MTYGIAVVEDCYSEVIVNVIDLALNWQLFSNVGQPRSFVNMMSTNSTLHPVLCRMLLLLCPYVNMNFGSVCSTHEKLWGGGGINGTLWYLA